LHGVSYHGVRQTRHTDWSGELNEDHYGPGRVWQKTFTAGAVEMRGNNGGMGSYVIFAAHPSNPPAPVAATECPAGWEQVGEDGADIGGCGLQSCGERYWSNNPSECADACAARSDCRGFNWAPMGGDRNHEAMTVCTLYNSDAPTSSWWGSAGHVQIFCKPEAGHYRYGDAGGLGFDGGAGDGNSCPTSDVSEAECLAAVQSLLPVGVSQGRTNLVAGSWGWVPPGCSVQSHFTHGQNGDWAAHYNRGNGNNDGGYTKVCNLPAGPAYHMLGYGMPNCPEGKTIDTREECEAAHNALGLEISPVWAGSHGGIPGLCSHRAPNWGGQHHLHFNSQAVGTIRDDLSPVCKV